VPTPAGDGYGCRQGYRQQSVISDFALGRVWAVYSSCAHPEAPRTAVLIEGTAAAVPDRTATDRIGGEALAPAAHRAEAESRPAPPLVHSGSPVRLWLSSPVARIALAGLALENGAAGATIRVRVMPGGKVLDGTVRAADSVELIAAGFDRAGQ